MHFIVVGAGIAGLGAAVALQRDGHAVTLVERAPELTEAGAGVVLGPHGMAALSWLGADAHIRVINERPDRLHYYDAISGDLRFCTELGEAGQALFGSPLHTTHRRDLIDALALQLQPGTDLKLGRSVVDVSQTSEKIAVFLDDGTTLDADALLGADGLKSTVRGVIFEEADAISAGLLAWRTVLPMEKLRRPLPKSTSVWMGGGRHAVAYPIRRGRQFYAAFYVPADEVTREDWGQAGDVRDLQASFAGACPDLVDLVNAVDEAFITGLAYRNPLPRWHSGRVLLIGDAAHSVIPTSGSGAALGLEDAVALVHCLRRHGNSLTAAFAEFEARRKPRTTQVLMTALADLRAWHDPSEERARASAARARGILHLDPTGHSRMNWLYGYNEPLQSQRAAEDVLSLFDEPQRDEARQAAVLWRQAQSLEDSLDEWLSERRAYDRFVEQVCPLPEGVEIEIVEDGSVRGICVYPNGRRSGPALLHVHGGYHVYGSARSAAGMAARIAAAIGGWAFVPDYSLAPERDCAAAGADVNAAYDWLQAHAGEIFLSGEDAGASLAVRLAQTARDAGTPLPQALYLLSPFIDKTLEAASIDRNVRNDPWVSRLRLLKWAGAYIQAREPADQAISPVYGEMKELPPIRIYAASDEALVDDAHMLHHAARCAGVDVHLQLVDDSVHVYALFDFLPETEAFLSDIASHAASLMLKWHEESSTEISLPFSAH